MPLLHRWVGTPLLSFLISKACGKKVVRDSQSGFRAFRRQQIESLRLQSSGMELASEMLIRAAHAGLRIEEIPAGYRDRIGQSKLDTFADGWRHLRLIFLLAPDLLLVAPGAAVLLLGAVLTCFGLLRPGGVRVGSLRWQPVFFSSICLVLGLQALLAGAVLAFRSSLARKGVGRRFSFVGRRSFLKRCLATGVLAITAGLSIDLAMFFGWIGGSASPPNHGVPIASLAQSLLMVGGTLSSFGVVARFTPLTPR